MPSTGGEADGSAADQAYFRTLEDAFLRLRGSGTLLSAADWQLASEWRRAGVPIELVVATMESLFERQRLKKPKRGISSLRYFRAAVAAAWDDALELRAGDAAKAPAPAMDIASRLVALAARLPADLPGREGTAAVIRALTGPVAEVEPSLAKLDRELLDRLLAALAPPEVEAIDREVAHLLEVHGGRLEPGAADETRERLRRQAVRRRWRLPVLSLFAPEAQPPEPD